MIAYGLFAQSRMETVFKSYRGVAVSDLANAMDAFSQGGATICNGNVADAISGLGKRR